MKIIIPILVAAFFATACAQLMEAQSKTAEQVARGVAEYCKNTDEAFRTQFRAEVNAKAAPNSIIVTCN